MTYIIHHGDALEEMAKLPDNSVSLIATDPPYFKYLKQTWDNQWDTSVAFLDWMGLLCKEWSRVLCPNGSLYVFCSPQMSAKVECKIGESFNVLNHIVWRKEQSRHKASDKETLRSFFPQTERIIFAEHYGADNMAKGEAGYVAKCDDLRGFVFEPLRAYLDGERIKAGLSPREVNESLGNQMAGHYFTRTQWTLPTRANYEKLREAFNRNGQEQGVAVLDRDYEHLKRDYEVLRREYDDLKQEYEELRRPFGVTAEVPYTDVWDFPTVQGYPGKHVCEKPVELLRHIIASSSRPGETVLDCFLGSGSTGDAAVSLGREFIGIEKDAHWVEQAEERLKQRIKYPQKSEIRSYPRSVTSSLPLGSPSSGNPSSGPAPLGNLFAFDFSEVSRSEATPPL